MLEAGAAGARSNLDYGESGGAGVSWKDVTAECEIEWDGGEGRWVITHKDLTVCPYNGYRVTRISGPLTPHVAFIVEKEE